MWGHIGLSRIRGLKFSACWKWSTSSEYKANFITWSLNHFIRTDAVLQRWIRQQLILKLKTKPWESANRSKPTIIADYCYWGTKEQQKMSIVTDGRDIDHSFLDNVVLTRFVFCQTKTWGQLQLSLGTWQRLQRLPDGQQPIKKQPLTETGNNRGSGASSDSDLQIRGESLRDQNKSCEPKQRCVSC